jgi:hypothetical protein
MDALALLHNTLLQVKEELLTAVSKPVEERATSYLERVCGKPFASIQLTNDFAAEKVIPVEYLLRLRYISPLTVFAALIISEWRPHEKRSRAPSLIVCISGPLHQFYCSLVPYSANHSHIDACVAFAPR